MNIHIFDIDWTLCKENWFLSNKIISKLVKILEKDIVYFNTWRWYKSTLQTIKNNKFLKEKVKFITENWSKYNCYNEKEKIFNFNKNEIKNILSFIEKNLENIIFFDFWLNEKLITISNKKIKDEHKNRKYINNFSEIIEIIYKDYKFISMFYLLFNKDLSNKNIYWIYWEKDLIITKNWVDKSYVLSEIKNYEKIFVYWNWTNDLHIFSYKKPNKINIWIWNNIKILELSDIKLESYIELEEYL